MKRKVKFHNTLAFLRPRLGDKVMQTIERVCDVEQPVFLTRTSKSYRGADDTVTALFQTKTGNELEIEFGLMLKGE